MSGGVCAGSLKVNPGTEEAEVCIPHSSFCPEKSRQFVVEVRPPCVPGEVSEGAHAGAGLGSRLLPFTCSRSLARVQLAAAIQPVLSEIN